MITFSPRSHDAAELHKSFMGAEPFRHVVIDNFLAAHDYAEASRSFPGPDAPMWLQYRSGRENKKLQSQNLELVPTALANVLSMVNQQHFVDWVSQVTGIDNLIADPEYHGGGLHQTLSGGHLGMHVDYNRHSTHGWHRRLNVIFYLNDDWDSSWGGALEFWTDDVKECVQKIAPIGNRLVIFETTEVSWHGHPDPLTPPPGVTRKSLAAYYYTEDRPEEEVAVEHSTVFRARPGEKFALTPREMVSKAVRLFVGKR